MGLLPYHYPIYLSINKLVSYKNWLQRVCGQDYSYHFIDCLSVFVLIFILYIDFWLLLQRSLRYFLRSQKIKVDRKYFFLEQEQIREWNYFFTTKPSYALLLSSYLYISVQRIFNVRLTRKINSPSNSNECSLLGISVLYET